MYHLPPAPSLHNISYDEKVEVLNHLFEPCSTLAELLVKSVMTEPHTDYTMFIEQARRFLLEFLEKEEQKPSISPAIAKIISAHPRLGPSKDKLSTHSASEQRSLVSNAEEAHKLAHYNDLYEKKFPGLRYVAFVNGRSREAVMENMEKRINRGNISSERREAFEAMCDIALDRARKLDAKL